MGHDSPRSRGHPRRSVTPSVPASPADRPAPDGALSTPIPPLSVVGQDTLSYTVTGAGAARLACSLSGWLGARHQASHQVVHGAGEAVSVATLQCVEDGFAVRRCRDPCPCAGLKGSASPARRSGPRPARTRRPSRWPTG
jgi:hypothetical protein